MKKKNHILTAAVLLCAAALLAAFSSGAEASRQAQMSFIIADGFSFGLGAGISERLRVAANLDIGRQSKSASASLILVYPKQFTVLTSVYGGAGLTCEFSSGAAWPHVVGGGEFGVWFAEFEWMFPPRNWGKLRSGLRATF